MPLCLAKDLGYPSPQNISYHGRNDNVKAPAILRPLLYNTSPPREQLPQMTGQRDLATPTGDYSPRSLGFHGEKQKVTSLLCIDRDICRDDDL